MQQWDHSTPSVIGDELTYLALWTYLRLSSRSPFHHHRIPTPSRPPSSHASLHHLWYNLYPTLLYYLNYPTLPYPLPHKNPPSIVALIFQMATSS